MKFTIKSGIESLQTFINQMWEKSNLLQDYIAQHKHHKTRLDKVSSENILKVDKEYTDFVNEFKKTINSFVKDFENPYFNKIKVHHSDVAKLLTQYKNKILNNKTVKNL